MRNGRSITLAESNVFEQVGHRIALTPSKINVRQLPGLVTQKQ